MRLTARQQRAYWIAQQRNRKRRNAADGPPPPDPPDVPENAIAFQGQPILFQGQFIIFTPTDHD